MAGRVGLETVAEGGVSVEVGTEMADGGRAGVVADWGYSLEGGLRDKEAWQLGSADGGRIEGVSHWNEGLGCWELLRGRLGL